jgi:hypothetical protein
MSAQIETPNFAPVENFPSLNVSGETALPRLSREYVGRILGSVPVEKVAENMQVPGAIGLVRADMGRFASLVNAFHVHSYGESFDGLDMEKIDVVVDGGISLGLQSVLYAGRLHSGATIIGIEESPAFSKGAEVVTDALKENGLIPKDINVEIQLGDVTQQHSIPKGADVVLTSLVSMYVGAETSIHASRWFNGDSCQGVIPLTHTDGVVSVPYRTKQGEYKPTGAGWQIGRELPNRPGTFELTLVLDGNVYGRDGNFQLLRRPGDRYESAGMIVEIEGEQFLRPWSWEARDGVDPRVIRMYEDITGLFDFVWLNAWDGQAGLGVPRVASQSMRGVGHVDVSMTVADDVPATLIPALLARYEGNVRSLGGRWLENHPDSFTSVDELVSTIQQLRLPTSGLNEAFTLHSPVFCTTRVFQ